MTFLPSLLSDGSNIIEISEAAFAYIEEQVPGVDVQAAMLNERIDPGNVLTPCVDVAWVIVGRPGLFFCHPKYVKGWPEIASKEILFKMLKVNAIYDGLVEAPWLVGTLPDPNVHPPGPEQP
jgi:hypothetical protein